MVGSQADICKKYKISSRTQLQEWIKVNNGHKELRSSKGRGSAVYMTKGRATTYEERIEIVSCCIAHGNDYTAAIEKYGVSYYLNHFETYEELVTAVEQFIHYYNTQRRQHRLDCQTPASYRSLLEAVYQKNQDSISGILEKIFVFSLVYLTGSGSSM